MADGTAETLHATCVAISGRAVLLTGPSGTGKSDLALRLIDGGSADRPARLVSDDYVVVTAGAGRLIAAPPPAIAGRLEIRGVGIVEIPFESDVEVALVVDLVDPVEVPRIPDRAPVEICGVAVPRIRLAPFETAAPAKVRAALDAIVAGSFAEDVRDG